MESLSRPLVRYGFPFFTGVCVAAALEVDPASAKIALLAAAAVFGVFSFPIGSRLVARVAERAEA